MKNSFFTSLRLLLKGLWTHHIKIAINRAYIYQEVHIKNKIRTFFSSLNRFVPKNRYVRQGFLAVGVLILVGGLILLIPADAVHAGAGDTSLKWFAKIQQYVAAFLSWIIYYLVIYPLSWFIVMLFQILTAVASYNEFLSSAAVVKGWVVVRDIANMSIIIFLLIIAFSIMLRLESYGNRKILAKLLLMAVLINFSKTICGFFIDISQLVMLTFVNGFKFITGVSLVRSMQLDKMMSMSNVKKNASNDVSILLKAIATLVLASLFMFVVLAVVIVIIMTLIWRIVNLWMLVILSPLAFLASAVPFLKQFTGDWYKKFTNFLVNGPILAFFLWLSLTIMNGLQQVNNADPQIAAQSGVSKLTADVGDTLGTSLTEAFTGGNITLLLISVGLLVGSLVLSAQFGALGANAAYGMIKNYSKTALKKGLKYTMKGQDVGLALASQAIGGKPVSFSWAGKKIAQKARAVGRKAQDVYYKGGEISSREGGALGYLRNAVASTWRQRGTGAKTRWTIGGRMDETQKQMKEAKKQEELYTERANYSGEVERLQAMETAKRLRGSKNKGDRKRSAQILQALGVQGVTDDMYEAQKTKVQEMRQKMSAETHNGEAAHNMDSLDGGKLEVDKKGNIRAAKTDMSQRSAQEWQERFSANTFRDEAKGAAQDYAKHEGHYQDLQDLAAKRRGALGHVEARRSVSAIEAKRMEKVKEFYPSLDNESEIAAYYRSNGGDKYHSQYLLKTASEQGLLKKFMKLMGKKDDMSGLRELLGYTDRDGDKVKGEHVELFQSIAKQGKKDGNLGFAFGVKTDTATGQTYFADMRNEKNGKSEQFNANMEAIEKNQISGKDLSAALVGDLDENGKQTLSEYGEEAFRRFGSTFVERIRRGNLGAAVEQAIADNFKELHSTVETDLESGGGRYTEASLNGLEQLHRTVQGKRGLASGDPTSIIERRETIIEKMKGREEAVTGLTGEFKAALEGPLQLELKKLQRELRGLNKQLGLDVQSRDKMEKAQLDRLRKGASSSRGERNV